MRILVIGGDGYCGWATALHLSARGHDVTIVDNLIRRRWDAELGITSLTRIAPIESRLREWHDRTSRTLAYLPRDVTVYEDVCRTLRETQPDAVVHFGQQRSAPYSMIDHEHALRTHLNNTVGNLNLLWALHEVAPETHLVKLGTMGEYGTPNIDIEEGFITIEHKGRTDTLPFPKQPGSFYHLTKVSDSDQIYFACRTWQLRATDLNQGVVYGIETPETFLSAPLVNRFDYDGVYGTVLNRFCVQAALRHPLTVYGRGGQTRAFLDIRDTVACIELALLNPAQPGEYRVFNQFTEVFGVLELARRVEVVARELGIKVPVLYYDNPRAEKDEHYYQTVNTRLMDLGLTPRHLDDALIAQLIEVGIQNVERIDPAHVLPKVRWRGAESAATAERVG
ncbi:MAG: NAD-dependent epimerase/dehydratase family protein [Vulcanimicrobiaceae bacterium]